LDWIELAWIGLGWREVDLHWIGLDGMGLGWVGLGWLRLDGVGSDLRHWIGLEWSGQWSNATAAMVMSSCAMLWETVCSILENTNTTHMLRKTHWRQCLGKPSVPCLGNPKTMLWEDIVQCFGSVFGCHEQGHGLGVGSQCFHTLPL